jgi:hypothetical protein
MAMGLWHDVYSFYFYFRFEGWNRDRKAFSESRRHGKDVVLPPNIGLQLVFCNHC